MLTVVAVPLRAHIAFTYYVTVWTARVEVAATAWASADPHVEVTAMTFAPRRSRPGRRRPRPAPSATLRRRLSGHLPQVLPVVVRMTVGDTVTVTDGG